MSFADAGAGSCEAVGVPLDRQPTLEGPTLRARPMREADRDALYAVASDPLLWEQHPAHDRWQRPVFDELFDDGLASGGALVVETLDGEVVGSSRYDRLHPGGRHVEIGWTFLARSRWGGQANGELKRLMLEHAFASVGIVVFRVGEANRRSRRAVEKLGAVEVGLEADPIADHVVYELARDVWRASVR